MYGVDFLVGYYPCLGLLFLFRVAAQRRTEIVNRCVEYIQVSIVNYSDNAGLIAMLLFFFWVVWKNGLCSPQDDKWKRLFDCAFE